MLAAVRRRWAKTQPLARARLWGRRQVARVVARVVLARTRSPLALLRPEHFRRKLFLVQAVGRDVALASTPELARQILVDRGDTFPKAKVVGDLLQPLIGGGLFGAAGASVPRARRLHIRAIAHCPEAAVRATAADLTASYVERWLALGTVAVCEDMARLTVDVVSTMALGHRFDEAESRRFTDLFFAYHRDADPIDLFAGRPKASRRRGLRTIGGAMRALVRDAFLTPLLAETSEARSAFGQALVEEGWIDPETGKPRGEASETAILDELMVLLLAGHETTASTLSWLIWQIAVEPERGDALAAAVADDDAATIDAYIDESLRLYPPIPFFARDVTAPAEFRGKAVAAGGLAVVSPWVLHRHQQLWRQPDAFLPERWRDPALRPALGTYLPFALGARACPGARFATTEMRTIVRAVFGACRFGRPGTGPAPRPLGKLTARPDREIRLAVTPRKTLA